MVLKWFHLIKKVTLEKSTNNHLLEQIDLVVTTTGNFNVCDAQMLQVLKKGAIICNIGHFDNEIDTQFIYSNWEVKEIKPQVEQVFRSTEKDNYLILLAKGRLVNLATATGHPSRIMDGSFANQVLAQMYLFDKKFADLSDLQKPSYLKVTVLPKKLDEEVALEMVKGFGGVVTKLSKEQAEYINVSVSGPFKKDDYRY